MNTAGKTIRVLLADDHALVRAGIRALLETLPGIRVVGEAGDGFEALDLVRTHQPDVVLMDVAMPGLNGLEATARVAEEFPGVRIIILSTHDKQEYVCHALKRGASAYLLKKAATIELETALKHVMNGEIYLSREIAARVIGKFPLGEIAE